MKNKDLIEKLQEFDPEMEVLKPGHPDGGGMDEIWDVKEVKYSKNSSDSRSWRGTYKEDNGSNVVGIVID